MTAEERAILVGARGCGKTELFLQYMRGRLSEPCPACKQPSMRVLYMGLPAKLCTDKECSTLFGGLSNVIAHLPFNGWFVVYQGSYWRALWHWVRGDFVGESEND